MYIFANRAVQGQVTCLCLLSHDGHKQSRRVSNVSRLFLHYHPLLSRPVVFRALVWSLDSGRLWVFRLSSFKSFTSLLQAASEVWTQPALSTHRRKFQQRRLLPAPIFACFCFLYFASHRGGTPDTSLGDVSQRATESKQLAAPLDWVGELGAASSRSASARVKTSRWKRLLRSLHASFLEASDL